VQAHGTGTPQNRVTESVILDRVAGAFGIENWPVAALKCYLGHSLSASSGDQLAATLGSWALGWLPGIATTRQIAGDVHDSHLDFCLEHRELDLAEQRYALVNAKGFGGNNATATLLSPLQTGDMLRARHGRGAITDWQQRAEDVEAARLERESRVLADGEKPRYRFDYGVLGDDAVTLSAEAVQVGMQRVLLPRESPFPDMHSADD
jgi:acetoacetyl-[acyl-carrier protein] synthase